MNRNPELFRAEYLMKKARSSAARAKNYARKKEQREQVRTLNGEMML